MKTSSAPKTVVTVIPSTYKNQSSQKSTTDLNHKIPTEIIHKNSTVSRLSGKAVIGSRHNTSAVNNPKASTTLSRRNGTIAQKVKNESAG